MKKVNLRQEGFNVTGISDPVYFFDSSEKNYVPLDDVLYHKIMNGEIRL